MDQDQGNLYLLDVTTLPLSLASLLGQDDRARFDRYVKNEDKALFLGGRLLLRHFFPAQHLSFGDNKRPYFVQGPCISLSHAYPYVVLAFAPYPVGVDIESLKRLADSPVVTYFPEEDKRNYRDLGELWCYKEAVFKACGEGYFDPREPLGRDEDGSFLFRGRAYYGHSFVYHDYRLVYVSSFRDKTCPISLPLEELL